MNKEELKKYREFMCNIENEFNCSQCPENRDSNKNLPCGQQNCWVSCHCKEVR